MRYSDLRQEMIAFMFGGFVTGNIVAQGYGLLGHLPKFTEYGVVLHMSQRLNTNSLAI